MWATWGYRGRARRRGPQRRERGCAIDGMSGSRGAAPLVYGLLSGLRANRKWLHLRVECALDAPHGSMERKARVAAASRAIAVSRGRDKHRFNSVGRRFQRTEPVDESSGVAASRRRWHPITSACNE